MPHLNVEISAESLLAAKVAAAKANLPMRDWIQLAIQEATSVQAPPEPKPPDQTPDSKPLKPRNAPAPNQGRRPQSTGYPKGCAPKIDLSKLLP